MHDWYQEVMTPILQAEDQMFAVKNRYEERREARGLLAFHFCVALPYITRRQWQERGFDQLTGDVVLLREDLVPSAIRGTLEANSQEYVQRPLTCEQWEQAKGVLRREVPRPEPH